MIMMDEAALLTGRGTRHFAIVARGPMASKGPV